MVFKLIAINAFASYGRTLLAMFLGLYSSRWVLQALGPVDFGLMGVVGAIIVFMTFFQGVLSVSVARFYALSIGAGNSEKTIEWFNTALSLHVFFPLLICLIGWPIGEWAVRNYLNVPIARLATALMTLRLSFFAALVVMITTPYVTMFYAKQCIVESSIWSLIQTLLTFGFVYSLTKYTGDSWLFYSSGVVVIRVLVLIAQVFRARHRFPECSIRFPYWFDRKRMSVLFSFAGWSVIGNLGMLLRGNGIAVLLNKFFVPDIFPQVNASFSVASNVAVQSQSLSTALMTAFSPEITTTEGRGDRTRMVSYSLMASRFCVMLIIIFMVPLAIELHYILIWWLVSPPEMAEPMCLLMLIMFFADKITFGQMIAVTAVGKVRGYQCTVGVMMIMTIPLAWLFVELGCSAVSVCMAMVFTMITCSVGRIFWARFHAGMSVKDWFLVVFIPVLFTTSIMSFVGYVVKMAFSSPGVIRLLAVVLSTSVVWCVMGWMLVLQHNERKVFLGKMRRIRTRRVT